MAVPLKLAPLNSLLHGKILRSLWPSLQKSTRVDQIDSFTSELVEKKAIKWELQRESFQQEKVVTKDRVFKSINHFAKSFSRDLEAIRKPELCVDIRALSQIQLDNVLSGIVEDECVHDFNYVIKQCIAYQRLPSKEVLTRCLDFLACIPQVETIVDLSLVCEKVNESFFKNLCHFLPHQSLALWRSGNVDSALSTLTRGYRMQVRNRKCLRETFRTIANETIGTKSEAVLVSITKAAEDIHQEFDETFLIACVWKNTFSSQWFSDQQVATELFEKYESLRSMIGRRAPSLCYNFLSHHDVDAVHRLIQLFLQYDNKQACSSSLKMLFNYQYWRRDLRACSEIMQFCLDIDLALPEIETQKLLNLLLKRPIEYPKPVPKSECNKFQYKF